LAIALNMMHASTTLFGTWAAGNFASAASAGVWAAGGSQFGGKALRPQYAAVRAGAFADTPLARLSLRVHARVQHFAQPTGYSAAGFRRRLALR
jgi:hypothetical protein